MKNIFDNKAPNRQALRTYFQNMGQAISEALVESEECFVMTTSGCPGGGKSMMTDELMNGALTASRKRIDDRSYWDGNTNDLHAYQYYPEHNGNRYEDEEDEDYDPEPETDPEGYIQSGERHYDMWQGTSNETQSPLRGFFFNSAVLPREHGEDIVRRVLDIQDKSISAPNNMREFYERPDPRAFMGHAGQLILISHETHIADVKPDFHADLTNIYSKQDHSIRTHADDDNGILGHFFEDAFEKPTHQHLNVNYDEASPYAALIESAHEANKHLLLEP